MLDLSLIGFTVDSKFRRAAAWKTGLQPRGYHQSIHKKYIRYEIVYCPLKNCWLLLWAALFIGLLVCLRDVLLAGYIENTENHQKKIVFNFLRQW